MSRTIVIAPLLALLLAGCQNSDCTNTKKVTEIISITSTGGVIKLEDGTVTNWLKFTYPYGEIRVGTDYCVSSTVTASDYYSLRQP